MNITYRKTDSGQFVPVNCEPTIDDAKAIALTIASYCGHYHRYGATSQNIDELFSLGAKFIEMIDQIGCRQDEEFKKLNAA